MTQRPCASADSWRSRLAHLVAMYSASLLAAGVASMAGLAPPAPPPEFVMDTPTAGSVHHVGDRLTFQGKVVDRNGWRPRSVIVKIAEKARQSRMHGAAATDSLREDPAGTFHFEVSLPVPRFPGEYVAWFRASGKPTGAGEETPPQIFDSGRVAFRVRALVKKGTTP